MRDEREGGWFVGGSGVGGSVGAALCEQVASAPQREAKAGTPGQSCPVLQTEPRMRSPCSHHLQKTTAAKRQRADEAATQAHTEAVAASYAARRAAAILHRAQAACETLDWRAGVESSPLWGEGGDAGGDDGQVSVGERLDAVIGHLRAKHHYCLWCGCAFDGERDLEANCPGPSEGDH